MKKILFNLISALVITSLVLSSSASAQGPITEGVDCSEAAREARTLFHSGNDILFYDPCANSCTADSSTTIGSSGKDYKGSEVFSSEQLSAITANQPLYEEAAKEVGMPWQMIAVIHLRESGLRKSNPDNGQGIYQDYERLNGPYPAGDVDDAEFIRQTKWAAAFLKNKASQPDLVASKDEGQIKDAFFGYNGKADVYIQQATSLGFSEGYEGSPYVMNVADAKRDPAVAGSDGSWGQIKQDGGPIEYPANNDHGAYVMYAALSGSSSAAACPDEDGSAGNFVYYSQLDPQWFESRLGTNGYIGADGCGPTSVAMMVATLTGEPVTPVDMTALGESSGAIATPCSGPSDCGMGDSIKLIQAAAGQYGLTAQSFTDSGVTSVVDWIKEGGLVLMHGRSGMPNDSDFVRAGPFSAGGHFIVIKGVSEDGSQLIIANPYSEDTGGKLPVPGQLPTAPAAWPAEQTFPISHLESMGGITLSGLKKS